MAENNELNDDELVDYDDEGEALEGVGNVAAGGDVKKCAHGRPPRARARALAHGACCGRRGVAARLAGRARRRTRERGL